MHALFYKHKNVAAARILIRRC